MSSELTHTRFPPISIIVPTYRESENIPQLIARIEKVGQAYNLSIELLIIDDNSQNGIQEVVFSIGRPWVRLVTRTQNRDLSQSILEGLRLAKNDIMVVMDADLSHPPEKIPEMISALLSGFDFVIGSRYVEDGSTDVDWSLLRRFHSSAAALLARLFTSVKDSMSGFFAIRKETFMRADSLNPIGYKIALELLVKCKCKRVCEIPIHFSNRRFGKSKLNLNEKLKYIRHLRRLFIYKYGSLAYLVQFGIVGFIGMIVNLFILTVLLWMGLRIQHALAIAIFISMVSNFILNRKITFSYVSRGKIRSQFINFIFACSLGGVVNYLTALHILVLFPNLLPQIAEIIGIIVGMGFNFFMCRYFVFIGN